MQSNHIGRDPGGNVDHAADRYKFAKRTLLYLYLYRSGEVLIDVGANGRPLGLF